jgi:hypothetical protein
MSGFTGGTFALYSLLCRHAKFSLLPNQQDADEQLSTYRVETPQQTKQGLRVKHSLEKHPRCRTGLLIIVLLGTCMVIADGVFTPAISGAWYPRNLATVTYFSFTLFIFSFSNLEGKFQSSCSFSLIAVEM